MNSLNNWISSALNQNPRDTTPPAPRGGTAEHRQERRNFPTGKSAPNPTQELQKEEEFPNLCCWWAPSSRVTSHSSCSQPKFTFPHLEKFTSWQIPAETKGPALMKAIRNSILNPTARCFLHWGMENDTLYKYKVNLAAESSQQSDFCWRSSLSALASSPRYIWSSSSSFFSVHIGTLCSLEIQQAQLQPFPDLPPTPRFLRRKGQSIPANWRTPV